MQAGDVTLPIRVLHLPMAFNERWTHGAIQKYMRSVRSEGPYLPSNVDFVAANNGLTGQCRYACMHACVHAICESLHHKIWLLPTMVLQVSVDKCDVSVCTHTHACMHACAHAICELLHHTIWCSLTSQCSTSLSTVHCPLSTVHCPLSTVHCPLSTVHCPLSTVHCPLSTVHCPLSSNHVTTVQCSLSHTGQQLSAGM